MPHIDKCPKCGRPGTIVTKWVLNKIGKRYDGYQAVVHQENGKRTSCYIGKEGKAKVKK